MAANNCGSSPQQGNFYASKPGKHPCASPNPIACPWCNQSFMSNEEFINHINSHVERGDASLGRYQLQQHITPERVPLPNLLTPANVAVSMAMQEARNFADSRMFSPLHQPALMYPTTRNTAPGVGQPVASLPPMHWFQSPPQRSNTMTTPNLLGSWYHMEESPVDGTMPYIKLLEKPFKGIEVINLDDDEDPNAYPTAEDLSLTL